MPSVSEANAGFGSSIRAIMLLVRAHDIKRSICGMFNALLRRPASGSLGTIIKDVTFHLSFAHAVSLPTAHIPIYSCMTAMLRIAVHCRLDKSTSYHPRLTI